MYELRARHTLTSYLLCRFTRAAHVMLASSELDGVIILDASIAATGHRQYPSAPEREHLSGNNSDSPGPNSKSESSEDSDSHSGNSEQNANSSSSKTCGILGAAPSRTVVNADGTPGVGSLAETNLARLLREYPHGKVFNYTLQGVSMSSTDDSSSAIGSPEGFLPSGRDSRPAAKKRHGRASRCSEALSELLPRARSVAFVPFWDYERSRWFAACRMLYLPKPTSFADSCSQYVGRTVQTDCCQPRWTCLISTSLVTRSCESCQDWMLWL
jgi:hypothetical protein